MMEILTEMLSSPLMRRGLLAALLVGTTAPVIGTYLVQRRLALLGDGIGHVALTGVALGWLGAAAAGAADRDAWAIPGAVLASVVGAVLIELVRRWGRTSGDVALALLFYGGIAGGVMLIGIAGGTAANLTAYLFGSIATVSAVDLAWMIALAVVILVVGIGLRPALFSLSYDEDFARATGLPAGILNIAIAIVAALTVSVAMRVVGVLLVSAIMIVPVAITQLVCRSFVGTMRAAMGVGAVVAVAGLVLTYIYPYSPGATIVLLAIGLYTVVSAIRPLLIRRLPHHKHEEEANAEIGGHAPCNA
ncbi:MAG: metal ABC transporter permease [Bowdeniella nasicola]|nr:metal ABC transporter permease [Bowdeniella nasicola]